MSLLMNASFAATPLAPTSDELQPWMIAVIAAVIVLALFFILLAARKSRQSKGNDIRETLVEAKEEAAAIKEARNNSAE